MRRSIAAGCAFTWLLALPALAPAQSIPTGTLTGNFSGAPAAPQPYTPPQVSAGGFTGNSTCGKSQNLVVNNTPVPGGFSTTSLQLYNVQWIILCASSDTVAGVGPAASEQAILVRNIYPNNIAAVQAVALLSLANGGCGNPDGTCVSTPAAYGGNDPGAPCAGQAQPTSCHLFLVANLSSPPNYGINNGAWGVVLSSRGCAEGPSGTVQTVWPWYACLMWNLTAGAPVGTDYFKFADVKYQHRQERLGQGSSPYNAVTFDHTLLRSGMTSGWQPFNPGSAADPAGQTTSGDVAYIGVTVQNTTSFSTCEVADHPYAPSLSNREVNSGISNDVLEFSLFQATGGSYWWSNAPGCAIRLKWWKDIYP